MRRKLVKLFYLLSSPTQAKTMIISVSLQDSMQSKKKSNLHYTRAITPKRVTSGGAHLRRLASGLHSSEETSHYVRFDRHGNRTSRTDSVALSN